VRRGDHWLFVAQVVEAGVSDDKAQPLVLAEVGITAVNSSPEVTLTSGDWIQR
jgi:hypothetical protein